MGNWNGLDWRVLEAGWDLRVLGAGWGERMTGGLWFGLGGGGVGWFLRFWVGVFCRCGEGN